MEINDAPTALDGNGNAANVSTLSPWGQGRGRGHPAFWESSHVTVERSTGASVGSDQIAEIAPGVREALAGGPSWCVTFEVSGDPSRWVQFAAGTINAAYPHVEAPGPRLGAFGSFAVEEWEPNKSVTGTLALEDARSIAGWIDRYFAEVLDCGWDYSIDLKFDRLG